MRAMSVACPLQTHRIPNVTQETYLDNDETRQEHKVRECESIILSYRLIYVNVALMRLLSCGHAKFSTSSATARLWSNAR